MGALSHALLTRVVDWQVERSRSVNILVETGTQRCRSTLVAASVFPVVHTVEASEPLATDAKVKLAKRASVHHGDSAEVLPAILRDMHQPVVFFLDAHTCNGAQTVDSFPLWAELDAIAPRPEPDVVIVDDRRIFGRPKEYYETELAHYPPSLREWHHVTDAAIVARLGDGTVEHVQPLHDQLIVYRRDRR